MTASSKDQGFYDYEVPRYKNIKAFIDDISNKIEKEFERLPDKYFPADLGNENAELLYDLIRKIKPAITVETGVCNGLSSAVILKALEDNQKGKLYSVDMPFRVDDENTLEDKTGPVIPPNKESGWVIPDGLRQRWTLKIGDTFLETPKIFQKEPNIDLFLHDSDHSYEGMMFEFSIAWRHLTNDGLLLADNIDRNSAFIDFAEGKNLKKYSLGKMGLLKK